MPLRPAAAAAILGPLMPYRRHRHHRSWLRRLRFSLRGAGVALLLALAIAAAAVWALPTVENVFSAIMSIPNAFTMAEVARKAKGQ